MSDMIKMIAAIIIFATVACVGLAFVYDGTKETIAVNKAEKLNSALKEIFPDADSFPPISGKLESGNPAVNFGDAYRATKGGAAIGIALNASDTGFNDTITALVGVGTNGKITGVRILQNTDTPGLGANASSPTYFIDKPANTKTFYGQFTGMSVNDNITVKKDGGAVNAITAATITSRAVSLLVSEAGKAGSAWLAQNGVAGNTAPEASPEAAPEVELQAVPAVPQALENGGAQ
ncbi:MAG: RnfABCDGE type electron transport complex subunit G [Spirochaetaceae bacterium]|jgi:electron transport complex protein RnfG|nr:RnfABCDGE type electron transport complex subunit G [Spirochaetaceae bacterium]